MVFAWSTFHKLSQTSGSQLELLIRATPRLGGGQHDITITEGSVSTFYPQLLSLLIDSASIGVKIKRQVMIDAMLSGSTRPRRRHFKDVQIEGRSAKRLMQRVPARQKE